MAENLVKKREHVPKGKKKRQELKELFFWVFGGLAGKSANRYLVIALPLRGELEGAGLRGDSARKKSVQRGCSGVDLHKA